MQTTEFAKRDANNVFLFCFLFIFAQGWWQPKQSQLIQIYSVDWTDVHDTTVNTEQNQLAIKVSADN